MDKDGGTASLTAETFLVIYDPSGGFVTGGGWIDSPPGAYAADPMLTGKANFGFVSKYKKGASVPTGNTEFHFKAGDLNFHSSSYDWLVVNQGGTNAQFKGSGTINGAAAPTGADYQFMIWAGDDDPDDFRIKIWHDDGGASSTFDAAADFAASLAPPGAGGTNPNGVWTYAATSGLFGTLNPFPDLAEPAPVNCSVGDMWLDLATHAGFTPSVARTRAACHDGNVAFDAGQLILHGGPPDQYAHVVFTAPADLTCTVSADYTSRQNGVSADVHVVHEGSALFSDNVVGGPGTQASYADIVTLAAGDALSFAVGLGAPPQSLHAGNVQLEAVLECGGGEVVVYDNGFGQELGGGSIVIHTKKN
jgi:hypothetical protein